MCEAPTGPVGGSAVDCVTVSKVQKWAGQEKGEAFGGGEKLWVSYYDCRFVMMFKMHKKKKKIFIKNSLITVGISKGVCWQKPPESQWRINTKSNTVATAHGMYRHSRSLLLLGTFSQWNMTITHKQVIPDVYGENSKNTWDGYDRKIKVKTQNNMTSLTCHVLC